MPRIVVHRRSVLQREYSLAADHIMVIGRHQTNDIVLRDDSRKVSRHHAAIVPIRSEGRYFVRDLGSLHATRVDGQMVDRHLLRSGDVIEIGDYTLVFSEGVGITADDVDLLRPVSRRTADGADVETRAHRRSDGVRPEALTPDRTELLDHLSRQGEGGPDLRTLLDEAATLVVKVMRADRGFIRLFRDGHAPSYEDLGKTGLKAGDRIEIADVHFMERLLAGRFVRDGVTLLAPVLFQDRLVALFCLDRHRTPRPFTDEDGEFLIAAGRRASAVARGVQTSAGSTLADPIAWETQIIGRSQRIQDLLAEISEAAQGDTSVLLSAETGSGKELAAMAIQQHSWRYAKGPFVKRDCSSLPEAAAETELFGYAPGVPLAGANPAGAPGWFEMAIGGTLFLDEIQSLSPAMQSKFLRVLSEKEIHRYGARHPLPLDVKVVAATSIVDLEAAVARGVIQEALYYRFRVVRLPPLRERREDIPLLAFYFLDRHAAALGARTRSISRRALQMLSSHVWRGNVRQLHDEILKAVTRNREVVFSWDLDIAANAAVGSAPGTGDPSASPIASPADGDRRCGPMTMREVECEKIKEALEATLGNISKARELLGYGSRMTILNKMDQLGIPRNYGDPNRSTSG